MPKRPPARRREVSRRYHGVMSERTGARTDERAIIHVDMDAFYASVEQRDEPGYRARPVIVGGLGRRGVVAAASYEARRFGVRSAMPMARARRLCPEAVYLRPRMDRYREVSGEVFAVFRSITPLVEGISVDEAWLDVTDSQALFGDIQSIGKRLKADIRRRTGLTASIGMAPNKFLAKLASEIDKPDGFCRVSAADAVEFLAPQPVERLWGIGPKAAERLNRAGIATIRDLRAANDSELGGLLGRSAAHFQALARGIDDRAVTPSRPEKSISHEHTFERDLYRLDGMQHQLMVLSEGVGTRLRRKALAGATVTLKVRTHGWRTYTRSRTLAQPTSSTGEIYGTAVELLSQWRLEHPRDGVRLLGVGISRLEQPEQDGLFHADGTVVDVTLDDIRKRFGGEAVLRGRSLNDREPE